MSFDVNDEGKIDLWELAYYETATVAGMMAAMRLTFSNRKDIPHTQAIAVQVGISLEQLQKLIRDLQQLEEAILSGATQGH